MSAFKGTPGPWRPSLHGPSGFTYGIEAGPSHDPVKIVKWGGIGRPSSETGQANARLIAAAPELLAELSHLRKLVGAFIESGGCIPGLATLNGADAAIAKATGGQS